MKCLRFVALILLLLLLAGNGCTNKREVRDPEQDVRDNNGEDVPTEKPVFTVEPHLVHPDDFAYLGAFRLPEDGERPYTFAYGGEAMTFNPNGDSSGPQDGFPGSLYIMGHNRLPYGELPDGNRVAEVTIPLPIQSVSISDLNQAQFLQKFHDVAAGYFTTMDEIPRVGMQYLDTSATGSCIHLAWGQHFHETSAFQTASHAWFDLDLSAPNMQGPWHIGHQSLYSVNDYLFDIPAEWAEAHVEGRLLATGRYRDGGWSGMGPALFAYQPWVNESGTPAPPQTRLHETVLLLYASSSETDQIERCLKGYQHADEWAGGAWLTTETEKEVVLFAGTKAIGERYWYGFINPAGPKYPCVEKEMLGQFTLCRQADGTPCPDEASADCHPPASFRGWWSDRFAARFILYDPQDLARVASGTLEPWEPQPYAYLDIDEYLFMNPSGIEIEMLGTGEQRRFRIGDVAYDRSNGLLYVLELFADEARPVVHVWRIP